MGLTGGLQRGWLLPALAGVLSLMLPPPRASPCSGGVTQLGSGAEGQMAANNATTWRGSANRHRGVIRHAVEFIPAGGQFAPQL